MIFGLYLGIYYILKFPLFIWGMKNVVIEMFFMGLTLSVPFITWRFVRIYRDRIVKEHLAFMQTWVFCVLIYIFAALIAAVAHFVYFRYIDHGYVMQTYRETIELLTADAAAAELGRQLNVMINDLSTLRPGEITLQLFMQNIFWGNLAALITALIIPKKPKI